MSDKLTNGKRSKLKENYQVIVNPSDSKGKEIVMMLPSEYPPASEVDEINSERKEENLRRGLRQHPINGPLLGSC
jgi:hypothetical protein